MDSEEIKVILGFLIIGVIMLVVGISISHGIVALFGIVFLGISVIIAVVTISSSK